MTAFASGKVKILFELEGDASDSTEIEAMWATPTNEGFEIDNIPFYAKEIALGDIVAATPDQDGILQFRALVRPSRHSTIRLWFAANHEDAVLRVRQELRDLGCPSELSELPRLVAVDVPPTILYAAIREVLDEYEKCEILEYEEACLGNS